MTTPQKPTLSTQIAELNEKVQWFYSDDFSLEDATEKYKSAVALAKDIQKNLETLKNEVTIIEQDFSAE